MVFIITIGCIIGMAFLVKYANKHVSRVNYVLVFIAGLINLFLVPKSEYDIYNFRCFEDLNVQLKDTTIDNNLGTLYKSIDYNIQIGIFLKSEGVWIVKKDKTKALFYGLRKK